MPKKPAYLIEAEARWERTRRDPDAPAEKILDAEDQLTSARGDAEADGYFD